jgi:hypothetical protein
MRALSALKSSFSFLASSLDFCSIELLASACSGVIAWIGGSAAGSFGGSSLPVSMTALPPERIFPEKASWRAFWSASNLDVFTDEIANSTMKRQNRSVIMSAKDTSQRSSFSCSSSSW